MTKRERVKHLEKLLEEAKQKAKVETLEKALDKACWCIVNNKDFLANTNKTEQEWREWFLQEWY